MGYRARQPAQKVMLYVKGFKHIIIVIYPNIETYKCMATLGILLLLSPMRCTGQHTVTIISKWHLLN